MKKFFVVVIGIVLVAAIAQAGSLPHTFTSGTQAKASDVNDNFNYVVTGMVPPGVVVAFAGTSAPAGWLLCDGSAVSRATYSTLYSVIGNAHGYGDNVSTFNVPDYRAQFLRGVDGSAVVSAGSTTLRDPDAATRTAMNPGGNTGNNVGSVQGDDFKSHTHGSTFAVTHWGSTHYLPVGAPNDVNYEGTIDPTGGSETRPKNAYVNYIIKY